MSEITSIKFKSHSPSTKPDLYEERFVALWALSEAALGGVLHAFQMPFTGLIINNAIDWLTRKTT